MAFPRSVRRFFAELVKIPQRDAELDMVVLATAGILLVISFWINHHRSPAQVTKAENHIAETVAREDDVDPTSVMVNSVFLP